MSTYKKKPNFLTSEEGVEAVKVLHAMVLDDSYRTEPSFSLDTEHYPDNLIPFIDKHMLYLRSHPNTEPRHYLSNLKMMTKIRD
ncbi:MAG: hypothetical protein WAQ57_02505 [Candidatus Saccharimonadales bacterium]